MKRLGFGIIMLVILVLSGCSSSEKNEKIEEGNLNKKLTKYKKCFVEKDYICMASFILPSTLEEAGGTQGFIKLMQSLPSELARQGMVIDSSKMKFGKSGDIINQDNVYISIIPTEQFILIQGQEGLINGSIIAFSKDKGQSWFFLEGTDESKILIADTAPELLQKIDIPSPTLKIGNRLLVQKNGKWIKDNSNSSDTNSKIVAEEDLDDMDMSPEELAALEHDMAKMDTQREEKQSKSKSLPISLTLVPIVGQNIIGEMTTIDGVDITIKGDDVKIDNVTANHGHCILMSHRQSQYPKTYQYGDVIKNTFTQVKNGRGTKCNVLSVEVEAYGVTNTYEFNK